MSQLEIKYRQRLLQIVRSLSLAPGEQAKQDRAMLFGEIRRMSNAPDSERTGRLALLIVKYDRAGNEPHSTKD